MPILTPKILFESTAFVDVAALPAAQGGYLVTVEHADHWSAPGPDLPPSEAALMRIWSVPPTGQPPREIAHHANTLPYGMALAMTVLRGHVVALVEANTASPGFLVAAPWAPPQAIGPFASPVPLDLDPPLAESVHVPPAQAWSTLDRRPKAYLFHPALSIDPPSERLSVAMNTADGKAAIWTWSPANPTVAPLRRAAVPAALEPVPLQIGERRLLLFRKMPANWALFFHNPRYSGTFGPVALPLMMAELDEHGEPLRTIDLSASLGLGGVFAFAACTGGASSGVPAQARVDGARTEIALAVATGTAEGTRLRLLSADTAGKLQREEAEAALRAAPMRVAMVRTGATTLVGIAYKVQVGRFLVEGVAHQGQ